MDVYLLVSLLLLTHAVSCEDILFPSGVRFSSVDPSSATGGTDLYSDPKNTGSYLFDASGDNEKKQLGLLVTIQDFKSQSSNYFRAHPVFVECISKVRNEMQNEDTPVTWVSAYKTNSDAGSSIQDMYARAGTGAVLAFRPSVTGQVKNIAKAALKYCPLLFEAIQRDIGLVLMSGSLHIHMTGADDLGPNFSAESGASMNTASFSTWAQSAINEGIDPPQSPDCSAFQGITSGSIFPRDVTSANEAAGEVDQPITRDTVEDLKTLQQYLGTNVDFANPTAGAGWCGKPGNPCVDCSSAPVGNHLSSRCAVRLMSSRMYNFIRRLQKMTRNTISGSKLKITQAFVEPYDGQTDYSATSLHVEGRQLTVQLTAGNTPENLQKVSQLGECIGIDFMEHKGDHLVLAVQKMKYRTPLIKEFGDSRLIAVDPPFEKKATYALPRDFSAFEEDEYPLFDSKGQEDSILSALITSDDTEKPNLGKFASKEFRYLRLHPLIPKCYAAVVAQLNKAVEDGEPRTKVDVKRAFISNNEQEATLDSGDPRYSTFTLGTALELSLVADKNPHALSNLDLLQTMVDKCAPIFDEARQEMGAGLYQDRVFVDLRGSFELFTGDVALIPEEHGDIGSRLRVYQQVMQERYIAARDGRVVDPDDPELAKRTARVPHKQSFTYKYTPSQQVDSGSSGDTCVPESNTHFCSISKTHREERIKIIWDQVKRKHHYHDESEVKTALDKCFGLCGTCLEGSIYEEKIKYCDEFIHWVPFRLMNENTISAFFPRDNMNVRKCARKHHTVEDAEIALLVLATLEYKFRPDPKKSVELELYPAAENPSPLMMLLHRLYAAHATGVVKVFVKDNLDVSSLKEPLEVLMMYNKNVSRLEVFPLDASSSEVVDGDLNNLKVELATRGDPAVTRQYLTPFSVLPYPECKDKRDSSFAIGDRLIEKNLRWESDWARQEL